MKLNLLCESQHTKIFVDFDETIGVVEPIIPGRDAPQPNPNLEHHVMTFGKGKYLVQMRAGWREFFHKLFELPNDGIYMYSSVNGAWAFPQLQKLYADDAVLSRVQMVLPLTVGKMSPFYRKHSILIDDGVSEVALADKTSRLKFNNVIKPSKFNGAVDNELATVLGEVIKKITELEQQHPAPQLESMIRLDNIGV